MARRHISYCPTAMLVLEERVEVFGGGAVAVLEKIFGD